MRRQLLILSRISHPHLVPIFAVFDDATSLYIVQELTKVHRSAKSARDGPCSCGGDLIVRSPAPCAAIARDHCLVSTGQSGPFCSRRVPRGLRPGLPARAQNPASQLEHKGAGEQAASVPPFALGVPLYHPACIPDASLQKRGVMAW